MAGALLTGALLSGTLLSGALLSGALLSGVHIRLLSLPMVVITVEEILYLYNDEEPADAKCPNDRSVDRELELIPYLLHGVHATRWAVRAVQYADEQVQEVGADRERYRGCHACEHWQASEPQLPPGVWEGKDMADATLHVQTMTRDPWEAIFDEHDDMRRDEVQRHEEKNKGHTSVCEPGIGSRGSKRKQGVVDAAHVDGNGEDVRL